jgi:hypothetical protein
VTKKDLLQKTKRGLLDIAASRSIPGRSAMNKADLVKAILKAGPGARKVSPRVRAARPAITRQAKQQPGPVREKTLVRRSWREQQAVVQRAKYEAKMEEPKRAKAPKAAEAAPSTPEPPASYGVDRIVLLVRDPYWVHVYWDISRETLVSLEGSRRHRRGI